MEVLLIGLLVPFAGTTAGAAMVYLMKKSLAAGVQKVMLGFAAGVMVAASVWSLIIPAMEMSDTGGIMSVVPAAVGIGAGMLFLLILDRITPHHHLTGDEDEGPQSKLSRTTKLALAVTIHNVPEGMAVGVALAAALEHSSYISMAAALALSVGIAIQNFPEGAIVSMPLRTAGNSRGKAFGIGVLSGVVEPIAAALTIIFAELIVPALPYMLSFAAGAMLYVVVEELIPETQEGRHSDLGTLGFAVGFILMMVLDVVLG